MRIPGVITPIPQAKAQPIHNPKCFANHLGPWLIEAAWFSAAVSAIKSGTWIGKIDAATRVEDTSGNTLYEVQDGVALLDLSGPMMKQQSKFGGVGTVKAREALRKAVADPNVGAVMMRIDSPGGSYAGTQELAA